MLDARGATGDADRGTRMHAEALVIYQETGMPRHADLVAGP
jgi:hypothetical protein